MTPDSAKTVHMLLRSVVAFKESSPRLSTPMPMTFASTSRNVPVPERALVVGGEVLVKSSTLPLPLGLMTLQLSAPMSTTVLTDGKGGGCADGVATHVRLLLVRERDLLSADARRHDVI